MADTEDRCYSPSIRHTPPLGHYETGLMKQDWALPLPPSASAATTTMMITPITTTVGAVEAISGHV